MPERYVKKAFDAAEINQQVNLLCHSPLGYWYVTMVAWVQIKLLLSCKITMSAPNPVVEVVERLVSGDNI